MGKKIPQFISRLQAEGTKADRDVIKSETIAEAKKLASAMPTFGPDRLMYVRALVSKALRKELDQEVFKTFVRMTNSYMEVESTISRAKLLNNNQRR